ncbi:MAG: hypothetical protein LBU22_00645 [Dysgonamonadaceae bacterium]|jgi:hypothetical protein|nr:hypothetical protein [Dysgonamonadaceae bacterium]
MKKRINLFTLVLLFLYPLGLHGQSDNRHFILTGEIKNTDADEVVLTYSTFQVDRYVRNIDTCHISNGVFTLLRISGSYMIRFQVD